jgi:hypothetical protein
MVLLLRCRRPLRCEHRAALFLSCSSPQCTPPNSARRPSPQLAAVEHALRLVDGLVDLLLEGLNLFLQGIPRVLELSLGLLVFGLQLERRLEPLDGGLDLAGPEE